METATTAITSGSARHSSGVAGTGVEAADVPAAPPERVPAPSSGQLAPRLLEDSATLLIIVIGMAAITVAAAFLLTML